MDTPFARLDPRHRRNIVGYLSHSAPQAVLLVHEGELTRDFVIDTMSDKISRAYELVTEGVFATRITRTHLRRKNDSEH